MRLREGSVMAAAIALAVSACTPTGPTVTSRELHIHAFSAYVPQSLIDAFQEQIGVQVTLTTYDSNEQLRTDLVAAPGQYDRIIPSDFVVERLIREDRLRPLDLASIPNRNNITESFWSPYFDPGGVSNARRGGGGRNDKYSLPYLWGTTGILYHPAQVGAQWLGAWLAIGGLVSAVGLFSAIMMAIARLPFVMAEDGYFPKIITRLHPQYGTPYVSIIVCALIYSVFTLSAFASLVVIDVILYSCALALEFVALIALRIKEPGLKRPFKIPGGWLAIFFVCLLPAGVLLLAITSTIQEEAWARCGYHSARSHPDRSRTCCSSALSRKISPMCRSWSRLKRERQHEQDPATRRRLTGRRACPGPRHPTGDVDEGRGHCHARL